MSNDELEPKQKKSIPFGKDKNGDRNQIFSIDLGELGSESENNIAKIKKKSKGPEELIDRTDDDQLMNSDDHTVNFQQLKFRNQSKFTNYRWVAAIFLVFFIAFGFYIYSNFELRRNFKNFFWINYSKAVSILFPNISAPLAPKYLIRRSRREPDPKHIEAIRNNKIKWSEINCPVVIDTAIDFKKKNLMNANLGLASSECFFISNQPSKALKYLRLYNRSFIGNEKLLNQKSYIETISLLENWKKQDALNFSKKRCPRWQNKAKCLPRLLLESHTALLPSLGSYSVNQLEKHLSTFNNDERSIFWLSKAIMSRRQAQYKNAAHHLKKAEQAAKLGKSIVRIGQIVEEGVRLNFYYSKSFNGKKIFFLNGITINNLPNPMKKRYKKLRKILLDFDHQTLISYLKLETSLHTRSSFFHELSIATFQLGFYQEYLSFIKKARQLFQERFKIKERDRGMFKLWHARVFLALGRFRPAFQQLGQYQKYHGSDATSLHLQGLSIMGDSDSRQYQILAAKKFKEAQNQVDDWQSLAAMGVALAQSGRYSESEAIANVLRRKKWDKSSIIWSDLILIRIMMLRNEIDQSLLMIDKLSKTYVNSISVKKLKLEILSRTSSEKYRSYLERLKNIGAAPGQWKLFSSLNDPLGPFAKLHR